MSLLAQLAVNLVGRTVDFEQGVARSTRQLKSFRSSAGEAQSGMGGFTKSLTKAHTRLLLLAAAKKAFDFTLQTERETLAISRQAKALGVSTKAFDRLTFAAKRTGFDSDVIVEGIRTLQEGVAEARFGSGELSTTMNELGISLRDLQGLTPDQQFLKFGKTLAQINDESQRTLAFNKAFGESDGFRIQQMFNERAFQSADNSFVSRNFGDPDRDPSVGRRIQSFGADLKRFGEVASSRVVHAFYDEASGTNGGRRQNNQSGERMLNVLQKIERNTTRPAMRDF